MNQIQSSSSTTTASKTHKRKKCCEASMPPEISKTESRVKKNKPQQRQQQQQQQKYRDPFQDLSNKGGIGSIDDGTARNMSSMSSTEAPKGCLRFFQSDCPSSSSVKTPCINRNYLALIKARTFSSKTPKSAPNIRTTRENSMNRRVFQKPISQISQKGKRNPPPCLNQRLSGKKPCRNAARSKISSVLGSGSSHRNKLKARLEESKQVVVNGVSDSDATNLTPLSKVASGSASNLAVDGRALVHHGHKISKADTNTHSASSNTKTPPVQASVSPEIQCGSTMASTTTTKTSTPACYAAGHVLSGITDKRKCRPRGLLTVGEAKALDNFDSDEDTDQDSALGLTNNSSVSMLPLPAEALMHWLLSPCNEEHGVQKENSEELYYPRRLQECSIDNCSSPPPSFGSGHSSYLWDSIAKEENRKNHCSLDGKITAFSVDSLDDENVIQTPKSDYSSDRLVAMSLLGENKQNFDSELNFVAEDLRMASLSTESHASIRNPRSSSFQFESSTTPSNSVGLSQFQRVLDDRASWFSNSASKNVSQSQISISQREQLVSRIFEMDEIDCCRCLSDEEDDARCHNNDSLKPARSPELNIDMTNDHVPSNDFGSTEFLVDKNGKEGTPQLPFSCAESISTDGGGLVRSEDSDWAECYKNRLF